MKTIKYSTQEEAINAIAEFDRLLGYPDETGTVTYCNVPEADENGEYGIEIDSYLENVLNKEEDES